MRVSLGVTISLIAAALVATGPGVAPATAAVTFVVDSAADAPDADHGDGACATAAAECTLRAAIEETNALKGMDSITLPAGTYALTDQLVIEDSVSINGAGATTTLLDGQDATEVLRVKTVEALVCDSGNAGVASYDRNGERNVDFVSSGAGGLNLPSAAAEGGNGQDFDVFVAGFTSGIHRYDRDTGAPKGLFIEPDAGGSPIGPTDLVFAPPSVADGDLLVTSFQPGGGIRRFDPFTGAFVNNFVTAGSGGLAFPNSIAIDGGDLYVTSAGTHAVLRYDGETGAFVDDIVPAGSGGLSTPRDLLFHDGALYVASEDNDAVLRYNASTGAFLGQFVTGGAGGLDEPTELSFGPEGDLYVLSSGTDQILRYDGETGAARGVYVEDGPIFLDGPSCLLFRDFFGEGPIANLSGLTLQNGHTTDTGGPTAGLYVDPGSDASLSDGRVRDNESSTFGGGIQNWGNLTLRRTEVTGNALPEGGGGQTSQGGGIFNAGNLDIEDSLVAENFATRGGGISNVNEGSLDLVNSTISENVAHGAGGGLRNVGDARADISFSTITLNRANEPGGDGEANRLGGGIYNDGTTAHISVANTIIAENSDNRFSGHADFAPDCYSTTLHRLVSERDNLIGVLNDKCVIGDVIFGDLGTIQYGDNDDPLDPGLAVLGFNGGPTRNHALLASSPAIDADTSATSATFFDCDDHDQRQQPRPLDGNVDGEVDCDLGAYEYQPPQDGDGVPPAVEDGAPNGGDGNADGIADRLQPAVTSLPNAVTGEYVTLVASDGSVLQNVVAENTPPPPGVLFPVGQFDFTVTADPDATVELIYPDGVEPEDYYKFGPEPGNPADHWYAFDPDGTTGAILLPDRIRLEFVDDERGDHDGAVNGSVHDPGGPVVADTDSDGLSDADETDVYGTDPLDPDTDDDGLEDGKEVLDHGTDPLVADTDGDGLDDGLEVAAGSDPLDADSDDDGVVDGLDADIIANVVSGLDAADFKASGSRTALLSQLSAVEHAVAQGNHEVAADQLAAIRSHLDGCGTSADGTDWIIDCEAQALVRSLVDSMISNL